MDEMSTEGFIEVEDDSVEDVHDVGALFRHDEFLFVFEDAGMGHYFESERTGTFESVEGGEV